MKGTPLRRTLILCVTLLLLSLAGCREEGFESKDRGALSEVRNTKHPGAVVLAKIGDEEITEDDLETAFTRARIPQRSQEKLKDKVLNDLIEITVFSNEAGKKGLEKDPEVKKALERMRNETLGQYFVKKYVDKEAEPPEEEIEEYYRKHEDQFLVPEAVSIQRILVKDEKKAEEVLRALKEGGSFEALAGKESVGRNWKEGGRLGWLFKGRMDPELEKAAFGLEQGKLSDIVKTNKGYQVIKVLDKKDERQIPLEEARARIRSRLFWQKKQEVLNRYYEQAKANRHPEQAGVLAKVGDETFTEDDIGPVLTKLSEDKVSEKRIEEARQKWIKYWIDMTVFSKEARKVQLENDPEVAEALKAKTDRVLAGAFRKRFVKHTTDISDKDVKDYYQARLEAFRTPLRIRVKSILVKTEEEAEAVSAELKGGAVFALLAVEKSLYPDASRRAGEIGWFGIGERDPALEKAALALEKGRVSGIIKTKGGFEIIKLMDKKGGDLKPLEKVTEEIKMQLMMKSVEDVKQQYYKEAGVKMFGP